jgi:stage V sporulation protein R
VDRRVVDHRLPGLRANYIAECEEKHGMQAVEDILDSCHALQNYGVDRYHRPSKISLAEEMQRRSERLAYAQTQVNDIWRTLPKRAERPARPTRAKRFPSEPQENILYFIEKNAPLLEPWQREVVASFARSPSTSTRSGRRR